MNRSTEQSVDLRHIVIVGGTLDRDSVAAAGLRLTPERVAQLDGRPRKTERAPRYRLSSLFVKPTRPV